MQSQWRWKELSKGYPKLSRDDPNSS
ncbi:hypothetical protein MTR67_005606 [Solanum verrucosum]|uniref:Uncharacterized protein n=1 Tax=Solanum verrucosum TaxID=315347 RepID=A0AAF0Q175_SOLVR|nr:hypothetical protein MTR67_005606 [Solanum verrucosum]